MKPGRLPGKRSRERPLRAFPCGQSGAGDCKLPSPGRDEDRDWRPTAASAYRRYMVTAKIADQELVEVRPAKGAVCRLAQKQVLDVLAEKFDAPLLVHAINAIGSVGGHVQIPTGVKSQSVGDPRQTFDEYFRRTSCPVEENFDPQHTVQVSFDDIEVSLGRVQGQAVCKVERAGGEQLGGTAGPPSADHSKGLFPSVGVAEVEIALGIEHAEVGVHERPSVDYFGEHGHIAAPRDAQQ